MICVRLFSVAGGGGSGRAVARAGAVQARARIWDRDQTPVAFAVSDRRHECCPCQCGSKKQNALDALRALYNLNLGWLLSRITSRA